MEMFKKLTGALLVSILVVSACGGDDGGQVRRIDSGGSASVSGSGSGSGSASGIDSGSGSASASGSASGTSPEGGPSPEMGAYRPLSDVSGHSLVVLDICAINQALPVDSPIDYDRVEAIYTEGGSSMTGDGAARTLAGFARAERDEEIWNDYVDYYGDPNWLDSYVMSAVRGSGDFAGEPDLVRRQAIAKGVQNQIMIAWTLHELVAALDKAADGSFDIDSGAPHNWDEGWAFYHGAAPDCAPYATADKRGDNFGTGTSVNDALAAAFTRGAEALAAGDADAARTEYEEIVRQITITYLQAAIRYAYQMDDALQSDDAELARIAQAEGGAFYRVIEPLVAQADEAAARAVGARFALSAGPPQPGSGPMVSGVLSSLYADLGISPAEIGSLPAASPENGAAEGSDPEVEAVMASYRIVFDSATPFDEKLPYLEDAERLRSTFAAYVETAQNFGGISLDPTAVEINGDTAEVTYNVIFGERTAYSDLTGEAVRKDGVWTVTRERFCTFMSSARVSCPSG